MKNTDYRSLRMIFIIGIMLFGASVGKSIMAQTSTSNKDMIKKLSHWEGKWKGEGWSMDERQQRSSFAVEENIQIKVGGFAMLMEGVGKDKSTGDVGFESLGLVYFDKALQKYQMRSMTADGEMALTDVMVNEKGEFIWEFDIPNGKIRYTTIVKEDIWNEKGEYIMKGSGQAFPILEMNLTRVKK